MSTPDDVVVPPADGLRYRPGLFAAFPTRTRVVSSTTTPVMADVPPGRVVVVEKPDAKLQEKAAKDAYERGRRDERARHRGSPLLAFIVLVIAVVGGTMIFLAAREGSFSRGGQVVDATLSHAAEPAKSAAASAGNALEGAGKSLKDTAGADQSTPSNAT